MGKPYASSKVINSAARVVWKIVLLKIFGTRTDMYASPIDGSQLCMLWQSFGVNHM